MHVVIGPISRDFILQIVRGGAAVLQYASVLGTETEDADRFGRAVGLDGDTLVVGAAGEDSGDGNPNDNSALDAGAVYVFRRSGTTWTQEAYLKASTILAGAQFGYSVAVDGDVLVVGAPDTSAEDGGTRLGRAYVFTRTGFTWSEEVSVEGSQGTAGDQFGRSVAIDGGYFVVGAPLETSTAGTWSGAAYVYKKVATEWIEDRYILAPNAEGDDQFGISVSISGERIAVGAFFEGSCALGVGGSLTDNNCDDAGAAYAFRREVGNGWPLEGYIKASNTQMRDEFGSAVSLSNAGDVLVVGAPGEDSGSTTEQADESASGSGAAYVYARTGTTWSFASYLKKPTPTTMQNLGANVDAHGDIVVVDGELFRRDATATWVHADTSGTGETLSSDGVAGNGPVFR